MLIEKKAKDRRNISFVGRIMGMININLFMSNLKWRQENSYEDKKAEQKEIAELFKNIENAEK